MKQNRNEISISDSRRLQIEKSIKAKKKLINDYYEGLQYQSLLELDFLKHMKSKKMLNLVERGPFIKYSQDKKPRKYYPDYYIPSLNLIIEIKSTYILVQDENNAKRKQRGVISKGYKFLMILDKNYLELDKILDETL